MSDRPLRTALRLTVGSPQSCSRRLRLVIHLIDVLYSSLLPQNFLTFLLSWLFFGILKWNFWKVLNPSPSLERFFTNLFIKSNRRWWEDNKSSTFSSIYNCEGHITENQCAVGKYVIAHPKLFKAFFSAVMCCTVLALSSVVGPSSSASATFLDKTSLVETVCESLPEFTFL